MFGYLSDECRGKQEAGYHRDEYELHVGVQACRLVSTRPMPAQSPYAASWLVA